MEVTDRTIEQIVTDLLKSGNTRLIVIACFLAGLAIGVAGMVLYYSKIRYYNLKKELSNSQAALKQAENERDEYKEKYELEKARAERGRNLDYISLAFGPDVIP